MKKFLLTVVLAASLLRVDSLFAWGPKGHDVVAYIAEQHLTNRARKTIDKILDGQSIVYFSSWMDNIQNSPAWEGGYDKTKTWHYVNVDEGKTLDTMEREPKGDVLTATEASIAAIRSGNLSDSLMKDHLKMLVHMIGDMHCPMHAGRKTDLGGNQYKVRWFGEETNLHSVWDSKFIESYRKWSYTEWQQMLDRADKKERAAIAAGTPRDWTLETVDISKAVYAGTVEGANLSYQYLYDFGPLCEEQLLKAGYRLAALLNDIFK